MRSEHRGVYFAYMGRRNPLMDWPQFFLGGRYPRRNHARQIWWRSLNGFMGGCGVKVQHFPLTLLVVLTTLSHYRVSVWYCWAALCLFPSVARLALVCVACLHCTMGQTDSCGMVGHCRHLLLVI